MVGDVKDLVDVDDLVWIVGVLCLETGGSRLAAAVLVD